MRDSPISLKAQQFTESVIREMTRLCQQHGGVNLAQGFPDFPAPDPLKQEAARALPSTWPRGFRTFPLLPRSRTPPCAPSART